jgi:plasmid stabilization system protein ParE
MNAERGFKLHPGAASDITSIWEFIAKDNPLAAKRVREDILDAICKLVPFSPSRPPTQRSHVTTSAFSDGTQLSYRLRTRRRAAPCTLRARRSAKPTRARGHSSWTKMNLRVGININWFARLRGTTFQNIVTIFVSRFPSFGRGFDPHRPYQPTFFPATS